MSGTASCWVDPAVRVAGAVLSLGVVGCGDDDSTGPEPPGSRCVEVASAVPFVELGTLGGGVALAYDVNDRGEVAGMSLDAAGQGRAVRWSAAGTITDLGTLPGYKGGEAHAVNARGDVAGFSTGSVHGIRAFVWTAADGMRDLGTLGGTFSVAEAISDDGAVVGVSRTASNATRAFLWTKENGMRDLGTLSGTVSSGALGVNARGQVVGASYTEFGRASAFVWSAATGIRELAPPAGVMGPGAAVAINDAGDAVGTVAARHGSRAVLWRDDGSARELGTLGGAWSDAFDINACGQVIGTSENEAGETRAFVWTEGGGMVELDAPADARSTTGVAISDGGLAVGQAETATGEVRPVRWRLGG